MRDLTVRSYLTFIAAWSILLASPGLALAQNPCDPPLPLAAPLPSEEHPGARRESQLMARPEGAEAPQISYIDSPSATCYQPDATEDVCWINWYYMSVDGGTNYMICMETTINAIGKVARSHGFFQTSIYVPYNMYSKGFRVACGALGAGGDPNRGNAYAYTIRAQDSAALSTANYGTVYCPAYIP